MVKKKEETLSEGTKEEGQKIGKFFSKNYWMIATILLALLLVGVLVFNSIKGISASEAEQKMVSFGEAQGVTLEVLSVSDAGTMYALNVSVMGQQGIFYISKDGKYFIASAVELETIPETPATDSPTQTTVKKSDKPVSELFIWSYCPYGVSAQKPFAQVAKLLGSSADFKIKLYYDGHGAYETQQNKIQACIQKYDSAKYWDYSIQFVDNVYPKCSSTRTEACDKTESTAIMKSLGIDSTKIFSCVASEGASLIAADSQRAQSLGVTGSPSLVINGVIVNAARTAEAYKTAVCDAFNSAPASCDTALPSTAGTTSGNC